MSLKLNYQLMKSDEVAATLQRLADEILEANAGRPVVLLGIHRRGVPMARRMAKRMAEKLKQEPQFGILDINLYRDDLTKVAFQPVVHKTEVPSDIDDHDIILVDDVLYTAILVSGVGGSEQQVWVRADILLQVNRGVRASSFDNLQRDLFSGGRVGVSARRRVRRC